MEYAVPPGSESPDTGGIQSDFNQEDAFARIQTANQRTGLDDQLLCLAPEM